jgi:preprotein translocase subunit SecB
MQKKKIKMNYKIVAKYIKDLKFEIPNPKVFFSLEKDIANYKINIDIKSNQFKNQIVEVETTLALNPINDNFERINTKIIFSTIIEIDGELTDKKSLKEIILIKVPNEVYPEIRSLFVLLFEKSGFNKIKIEENIDFKELYLKRTIQ